MDEYDDYRINLLAKAIMQLNERAGHVIDEELYMRLQENFQYHFNDKYEEENGDIL